MKMTAFIKYTFLAALVGIVASVSSIAIEKQHPQNNLLITAEYQVLVTNEDGKIIENYSRPSDSYIIGFADTLFTQMSGVNQSIQDTANATRTCSPYSANLMSYTSSTSNSLGIVVGSGTNAVGLTNYGLQTIINHGTGAGQLTYFGMTYGAPTTSGTSRSFTLTRTFTNNSAGSITVNECGIYSNIASSYYTCTIRDLIAGGQAVGIHETLTITYTITITV